MLFFSRGVYLYNYTLHDKHECLQYYSIFFEEIVIDPQFYTY